MGSIGSILTVVFAIVKWVIGRAEKNDKAQKKFIEFVRQMENRIGDSILMNEEYRKMKEEMNIKQNERIEKIKKATLL